MRDINEPIKAHEAYQNAEDIYWAMLMALESICGPEDIRDRQLVEAAYRQWNTRHPEKKPVFPRWVTPEPK